MEIANITTAWEVKTDFRGQSKHGLWGSYVKTGKYLPGLIGAHFLYIFGPKRCNTMSHTLPVGNIGEGVINVQT